METFWRHSVDYKIIGTIDNIVITATCWTLVNNFVKFKFRFFMLQGKKRLVIGFVASSIK